MSAHPRPCQMPCALWEAAIKWRQVQRRAAPRRLQSPCPWREEPRVGTAVWVASGHMDNQPDPL